MPAKTVKPRCLSRIRSITRLVSRCTLARSALLTSRVKRLRPDLSPRALTCASSAAARRRRRCKRRSRLSTRLVSRPASARSAATTIRLTMPPKARWHRACVLASRVSCLSRLFGLTEYLRDLRDLAKLATVGQARAREADDEREQSQHEVS